MSNIGYPGCGTQFGKFPCPFVQVNKTQHFPSLEVPTTTVRSKMKRNLPWCEFPCSPDDLIRAVCFRDVTEIAAEIGVDVAEVGRWRSGHKPVPKLAYLYLAHKSSTVLGHVVRAILGLEAGKRWPGAHLPGHGRAHQLRRSRANA